MNGALALPDRLARFREAGGKMDEALREEGFDEHGSHAVFVRWQRESVEGLGGILLEAEKTMGERVETACAQIEEASRRFRDDEFRRAELLLRSGQEALKMARQAADTAAAGKSGQSGRPMSLGHQFMIKTWINRMEENLSEVKDWLP